MDLQHSFGQILFTEPNCHHGSRHHFDHIAAVTDYSDQNFCVSFSDMKMVAENWKTSSTSPLGDELTATVVLHTEWTSTCCICMKLMNIDGCVVGLCLLHWQHKPVWLTRVTQTFSTWPASMLQQPTSFAVLLSVTWTLYQLVKFGIFMKRDHKV